jgi:RNA polymerase sigma factor (sigma-70 family)
MPLFVDCLDEYTETTIHHHVSRLIGRHGFTENDRDDLKQELAQQALICHQSFNEAAGKWSTYLTRCLERRSVDLIRRQRRQCRDAFKDRAIVFDSDEESGQQADTLIDPQAGSAINHADLKTDIATVMQKLSAIQQDICRLLPHHSAYAVSRMLGISKRKVYQAIEDIRRVFRQAGLDGYC